MSHLRYLSRQDVAAAGVTMSEIIDALATAFAEKGRGHTEMPPKPGIHPGGGDNFIHAMPAYIPALQSAGLKWVSGYPQNARRGLPYINGLLILNDVQTGIPLAVMDCVWITAMRTGAATALSARYLARSDSRVVGMLGCGVQGRTNVEALQVLFPLVEVRAYDVDTEGLKHYAEEIETRLGLAVQPVKTPREAVSGCDIVVTAGPIQKKPHATIRAGWFDAGTFASLVDFDSYCHPEAVAEADRFCTDDTEQYLHYRDVAGFFQDYPDPHADLGQLVTGQKAGRQNDAERNITANLGLAIDDMAVAPIIYRHAVEKDIGMKLPL
jgi:ornithine cyclodeaminase/alanine dehydrogenase